ncbi:MAG: hypothetical protein IKM27_07335 [Clostridia bacterium]|nr:hypothetical protein [Clostridia bacterium]
MKKKIYLIALLFICLSISSCVKDDGSSKILCDTARVEAIVKQLGVTEEERLVVKKPYDRALDCNVYLVYIVEDGEIKEYTCEFYGNLAEHNYALNYYNADSVKELYSLVENDEAACMVCVLNLAVEFDSLEDLEEKYSDKHYVKHGYEIIR